MPAARLTVRPAADARTRLPVRRLAPRRDWAPFPPAAVPAVAAERGARPGLPSRRLLHHDLPTALPLRGVLHSVALPPSVRQRRDRSRAPGVLWRLGRTAGVMNAPSWACVDVSISKSFGLRQAREHQQSCRSLRRSPKQHSLPAVVPDATAMYELQAAMWRTALCWPSAWSRSRWHFAAFTGQ